MNTKVFLSIFVITFWFFSNVSISQENKYATFLSGSIGYAMPYGDFGHKEVGAAKPGLSLSPRFMISISDNIGFFVEYNYGKYDTDLKNTNLETYWTTNDLQAGMRFTINSPVNFFFEIGPGIYNATAHTEGSYEKGLYYRRGGFIWLDDQVVQIPIDRKMVSNDNIGLNLSIGTEINLKKFFIIEFFVKYIHYTDDRFEPMSFDVLTASTRINISFLSF